jgi:hypothetical protein
MNYIWLLTFNILQAARLCAVVWHVATLPGTASTFPGCDDMLQYARDRCAPVVTAASVVTVASAAASRCALEWWTRGAIKSEQFHAKQSPESRIHGLGRKGFVPRDPPSLAEPTRSPADKLPGLAP